ncbi:glycosyltransferase family 2 protein [Gordonia rhizosphera]|uniref:Putative glycosyltransferase n=1 Tax=Gordonia rhizosphera NBRC 16068 TaxID=1108045 RepID=K6WC82_9ACTN|nr:glycosyltransferase family A protein [Gordonia rhizosphera]GAB91321.1 putative glycosyltransferase [Gordonia rhizosphera NBRC 16068]
MADPRISLVCSTIGRPLEFRRLLESVLESDIADQVEFILVDQSEGQECAAILRETAMPGPTKIYTSGRGASTGRNVGTIGATSPVIAYPDDNCWYGPTTLSAALALLDADQSIAGLSAKQVTRDGSPSMLRWLPHRTTVTRTNFLRTSICSTLFLRRLALPSPAPFDEGIGVGSSGLRGAGEESDLILRMLACGARIAYSPEIHVYQDDDRDDISDAFVEKMFRYGVGNGHLWRRHHLSRTLLCYQAARKLVGSAVRLGRGNRVHARADIAYLRGEFIGYFGRDVSRTDCTYRAGSVGRGFSGERSR